MIDTGVILLENAKHQVKCKYCGHEAEREISQQEERFAKLNNSKTLTTVWICPDCGKDNLATFEIPD